MRAPRMMVYAPNGDLFVSSPATNSITVLRDANNDGMFEARSVYAAHPPRIRRPLLLVVRALRRRLHRRSPSIRRSTAPILGASAPACMPPPPFNNRGPGTVAAPFGMAFHDGYLYVGNTGSLVRFKYTNGDLKAQGEPEKLLDLPTGGHSTRNVIFNRAGTKMYVSVGSMSNNNAGEDCRRAAILEFNPDGSGYRVFASGIRNPVGLDVAAWNRHPVDRDERARQSGRRPRPRLRDFASKTADSTGGRIPTSVRTTIRATSARSRNWSSVRSSLTC